MFSSQPLASDSTEASTTLEDMAPKVDPPKKPTTILGVSRVNEAMIANMVECRMLVAGAARPPLKDPIMAKPEDEEVVIFHDFFIAGLRFPVDPALVDILR